MSSQLQAHVALPQAPATMSVFTTYEESRSTDSSMHVVHTVMTANESQVEHLRQQEQLVGLPEHVLAIMGLIIRSAAGRSPGTRMPRLTRRDTLTSPTSQCPWTGGRVALPPAPGSAQLSRGSWPEIHRIDNPPGVAGRRTDRAPRQHLACIVNHS